MNSKFFRFILLVSILSISKIDAQNIQLKIHLGGVYSSKVSVIAMAGPKALKPVIESPAIKNGESTTLEFTKDMVPSQFVLRFDYQEKETSNPYPSEKLIFVNNQNLELWVNPRALQKRDSTYFQQGEKENAQYDFFHER